MDTFELWFYVIFSTIVSGAVVRTYQEERIRKNSKLTNSQLAAIWVVLTFIFPITLGFVVASTYHAAVNKLDENNDD